ncbi:MAG: D-glycerate dehydrogenase [Gemmatimonadetes bacterium]|uniref:D-glycerate dehydrogenase n=1 Tax=Candidatus Kutchimonas denitrificans TaxID=3056748 RepID=A0AAE4ZBN1_9BACT|nr:D-glycerate dehydrogenase [Gemmatimonadota bacterium]NIR75996.1 D-glycerate dehydrogenase [Candidatus Kutchimonas denitrificans]NIS02188.1 D-glycerate dehydrogenase [Gemmatimonadota bacterium]NIT68014.1 D-glycerate dehydrogenase [Gemmatimonadota bacterium]NIU54040.1 D-glycerate dehydrogenase [Gemmatimonadota bacterium]
MAETKRVVVAAELRPFIDAVERPDDVQIEWVSASEPLPEGGHVGLLPLLSREVDESVLERLPDLKVVANYAVGYDNIDVEALTARGVAVSNTPDVLTEATADLTWTLILAVTRRVHEAEELARHGDWAWEPTLLLGMGLGGRTLVVLGAGRIGQAVGRRALPFGMDVCYWDRARKPEFEAEVGARRVESLAEALTLADVASIHLQLSPETAGLIGAEQLGWLGPDAVLINTARGGIVDEDALCDALESGRLRGAGLDVYDGEPRIRGCLKRLSSVVLLPHIGSATEETRREMFRLAWTNLMKGIRGQPLVTPIEPTS